MVTVAVALVVTVVVAVVVAVPVAVFVPVLSSCGCCFTAATITETAEK